MTLPDVHSNWHMNESNSPSFSGKAKETLQRVWPWLKKWGLWIIGVVVAVLSAGWLFNNRVRFKRNDKEVEKIKVRVAEVQARSQALEENVDADETEIVQLERTREAVREEIVVARRTAGMTDAEALAAFDAIDHRLHPR